MSYLHRYERAVTTSTGGTATVYLGLVGATATAGDHVNGFVEEVFYKPSTSTGTRFASTADITWTADVNSRDIFLLKNTTATANVFRAPRQKTYGATGGELLYETGQPNVEDKVAVAQERIKVTVAGGGASKTGTVGAVIG